MQTRVSLVPSPSQLNQSCIVAAAPVTMAQDTAEATGSAGQAPSASEMGRAFGAWLRDLPTEAATQGQGDEVEDKDTEAPTQGQ